MRKAPHLVMCVAALAVACGDADDTDIIREAPGPVRLAIQTEGGDVELGLTDDVLYVALSDSLRDEIQADLDSAASSGGFGGFMARIVRGTVSKALHTHAIYPLEDVRDVRWERGALVFEFTDPDQAIADMTVDDRPFERSFAEEDAQRFIAAFREAKRDNAAPTSAR